MALNGKALARSLYGIPRVTQLEWLGWAELSDMHIDG